MTYWFPKRVKSSGFPAWVWLFPPFWIVLVPLMALWLVALVFWLIVSIPVNLVRLATHRESKPLYDVYTGERLR